LICSLIQSKRFHRHRHHSRNDIWDDFVTSSDGLLEKVKVVDQRPDVLTLKDIKMISFNNRVGKNGYACSYYDKNMRSALFHCSYINKNTPKNVEEPFEKLEQFKKISVYLSEDNAFGHRQVVQCFGQTRNKVVEIKKIIKTPGRLNYYLDKTKKYNAQKFLNGFRGKRYIKELLNTAIYVKELFTRNLNSIFIIQSLSGDLATAVSALVHVLIHQEKNGGQINPRFVEGLINHEFYNGFFRMLYFRPIKQIIGRNAVYLAFLGALRIKGVDIANYLRKFENRNECVTDELKDPSSDQKTALIENILNCQFLKDARKEIWLLLSNAQEMREKYPRSLDDVYNDESLEIHGNDVREIDTYYKRASIPLTEKQKTSLKKILVSYSKIMNSIEGKTESRSEAFHPVFLGRIFKVFIKETGSSYYGEDDAYYTFLGLMLSPKFTDTYNNIDCTPVIKASRVLMKKEIPALSQTMYGQLTTSVETFSRGAFFQLIDQTFTNLKENERIDFMLGFCDRYLYYGPRFPLSCIHTIYKHTLNYDDNKDDLEVLEDYFTRKVFEIEFYKYLKEAFPNWKVFLKTIDSEMISEEYYNELYKIHQNLADH